MRGTQEFDELMAQFESNAKTFMSQGRPIVRCHKDPRVPKNVFYEDGLVNDAFQAYMHGYAYAKALARQAA